MNSRVEQGNGTNTVAGSTNTVSVTLSGTGTVALRNRDGSGAFGVSGLNVTLTSTPTRYSVTRTSVDAGTILQIDNISGLAITDLQIRYAQIEAGSFATDYIPNASTTVSASAGADDLQIAASSLPASGPIVFIADLPAQTYVATAAPRVFDWTNPIMQNSTTSVNASAGAGTVAEVTGLATTGARRAVMLYTPGAATRLSVNGSAVAVGTDVGGSIPVAAAYIGNRAALDRPLVGSLGIFAA
jgi:hypothetical protein